MENMFSLPGEFEQIEFELIPAEHADLPAKETKTLPRQNIPTTGPRQNIPTTGIEMLRHQ
jgi:hypothetical protein